jgi:hypothetical protein
MIFSKVIASAMVCGIMTFSAHGTMLSPAKICGQTITSSDLRTGGEINLSVVCASPKQDMPLVVEYILPLSCEVLAAEGNPKIERTPKHIALRWEGLWSKMAQNNVRLRIGKPGFYKFYGRVMLGSISEKHLKEIMLAEVSGVPGYFGADEQGTLHKQEYLSHPERFRQGLEKRLSLTPDAYYISVDDNSGRIEPWDFGSYWKRLKHWLQLKWS